MLCYSETMLIGEGVDKVKPDASFDLDGTVFKFTVLEQYTHWLCEQGIFRPLPDAVLDAKAEWKADNTEANYTSHLNLLVGFFVDQIPGKDVSTLEVAAEIVANQERHRRWNVTTGIISHLRDSHNLFAISLMPEWLMAPFARDLGFTAMIGSTYVVQDGRFTDEAHTIDKALAYAEHEHGTSLVLHMGDTVGDGSLFDISEHPVLFNPSRTLLESRAEHNEVVVMSHKDTATVIRDGDVRIFGAPFDIADLWANIRGEA